VITAEISIGLPLASLTLSTSVSRLRIRSDRLRRMVSGLTQWNPERRTVPRYRPRNVATLAWFGWTMMNPWRATSSRRPRRAATPRPESDTASPPLSEARVSAAPATASSSQAAAASRPGMVMKRLRSRVAMPSSVI
jgi:hypothetical protein